MQSLLGMTTAELGALAAEAGQPAYRGRQLAAALYRRHIDSLDGAPEIPGAFRRWLQERFELGLPRALKRDASPDGTVKYLLELGDSQTVECVLLPYPDRVSVCLSSQVGCPAGCRFCATGLGGMARSMAAGEIVGQLLRMQRESTRRITHAVYMGMGEPLWNYESVVRSIRLLRDEVGLSPRSITVSTVGVVPGIYALAEEELPITLALSLHAPDDELRASLIPTARKWKLDQILSACAAYAARTRRNLTFEYLLLGGVNDSPEQAAGLASLLNRWKLPGNVNLIPFNAVETEEGFRRPSRDRIRAFRAELERAGRVTTQRITRGHAVSAACGQLKRLESGEPSSARAEGAGRARLGRNGDGGSVSRDPLERSESERLADIIGVRGH